MYVSRTISRVLDAVNTFFPVILISGPRQVGKTTVFRHSDERRTYVSLDTLEIRQLAQQSPELFLQRFPPPVLIDEIQYAPDLLPYIKARVDASSEKGQYWITGSQQFQLMKNVTESLAGRVCVLRLQGLSRSEKNRSAHLPPFLPTADCMAERVNFAQPSTITDVYHEIWKGSYPALHQQDDSMWGYFYESYVQTYIERDIRELTAVANELTFLTFIKALAARTSQLLNYADLARDVGVSQPTIKSWISILQSTGMIYLLQPYSNNITNRFVKTPKLYFVDTGLAAYLAGWHTPIVLERGAMNGAFFETYVVSEILKSYWHNGKQPNIYFYRDKDKKEVDILIEENGVLYPIEIKKSSNPVHADIRHFKVLEHLGKEIGEGAVICLASTHLPITDKVTSIPVNYI